MLPSKRSATKTDWKSEHKKKPKNLEGFLHFLASLENRMLYMMAATVVLTKTDVIILHPMRYKFHDRQAKLKLTTLIT